jgi:hypothetical protein
LAHIDLASLKALVYARLEGNTSMYSDSEITWAINEAISCGNLICGWSQDTYRITGGSVPGRHIYDVPEGIIFPIRVCFMDEVLEKGSLSSGISLLPELMRDTTASTGKPVSRWFPIGITKFAIHPADSVGGGAITVTGITEFPKLTASTDDTQMPKESITAVCDYAAHIVQCKMQGAQLAQSYSFFQNWQNLTKLDKYWQTFSQPNYYFDEQNLVRG